MIDKLKIELEKNYPNYQFKVLERENGIEIIHNNQDRIGDIEFIDEVLEIFYHLYSKECKSIKDEDELPEVVVVYDFLNRIDSKGKVENRIEVDNINSVFSKEEISLNGIIFFKSFADEYRVVLSCVNKNINERINKSKHVDFGGFQYNSEKEYYPNYEDFKVNSKNLLELM